MWAKCIAFGDTFDRISPIIAIYISKISSIKLISILRSLLIRKKIIAYLSEKKKNLKILNNMAA